MISARIIPEMSERMKVKEQVRKYALEKGIDLDNIKNMSLGDYLDQLNKVHSKETAIGRVPPHESRKRGAPKKDRPGNLMPELKEKSLMHVGENGFEAGINRTYGIIIAAPEKKYLILSNRVDPLMDEKQKKLPDYIYPLLSPGTAYISQSDPKKGGSYCHYETPDIRRILSDGFYKLVAVEPFEYLFEITELDDADRK